MSGPSEDRVFHSPSKGLSCPVGATFAAKPRIACQEVCPMFPSSACINSSSNLRDCRRECLLLNLYSVVQLRPSLFELLQALIEAIKCGYEGSALMNDAVYCGGSGRRCLDALNFVEKSWMQDHARRTPLYERLYVFQIFVFRSRLGCIDCVMTRVRLLGPIDRVVFAFRLVELRCRFHRRPWQSSLLSSASSRS